MKHEQRIPFRGMADEEVSSGHFPSLSLPLPPSVSLSSLSPSLPPSLSLLSRPPSLPFYSFPAPPHQPDTDPGDVIVLLQPMDHTTFKRNDDDLFVMKKISLVEALCGFTCTLEHLDGRKLLVSCRPGEVLAPGGWVGGGTFAGVLGRAGHCVWICVEDNA